MLTVKNLSKSFKKQVVLNNVSFHIGRGEIVTLLGANGSGKTTIINCILKMLRPEEGSIELYGKDIRHIKNSSYFTFLNAVLESSSNVYDYLTGRQNIEYFCRLSKVNIKDKRIKALLNRYIRMFDLEKDLDKCVGNYSRGMQQKLSLVIALLSQPQLLILDEPTLGLDIKSKQVIINQLKEIVQEQKMSVLITTHQMDVVEKLNGRILLLKNHQIMAYSSLMELVRKEEKYQISYISPNGEVFEEIYNGSLTDLINQFKDIEIVEVKRVELDVEEYLLEKIYEPIH